jgi:hypothetical protein
MKKFISIALTLMLITSLAMTYGCGRQPTSKHSVKIIEKYFKKYSKKYPDSIIGKYPVQNVRLLEIEEVHKDLVAAYAILELQDGMAVQTRFSIEKKAPFGWRALSWENMGLANYGRR